MLRDRDRSGNSQIENREYPTEDLRLRLNKYESGDRNKETKNTFP